LFLLRDQSVFYFDYFSGVNYIARHLFYLSGDFITPFFPMNEIHGRFPSFSIKPSGAHMKRKEMTMFREAALTWISELEEGGKHTPLDAESRSKLANEYAQRLEEIFNEEVSRQLKPLGKDAEFERMLMYDSQYTHKYLNQTIPAYYGFRAEVFKKARRIILGE
jgi:hypothetical protein